MPFLKSHKAVPNLDGSYRRMVSFICSNPFVACDVGAFLILTYCALNHGLSNSSDPLCRVRPDLHGRSSLRCDTGSAREILVLEFAQLDLND